MQHGWMRSKVSDPGMFQAENAHKTYLGLSPVVPVILAIPTVLCRTDQQVFSKCLTNIPPQQRS